MHIAIINGPNLGRIGSREVDIYGVRTMESLLMDLRQRYEPMHNVSYFQSNKEGDIIDEMYRLEDLHQNIGIILNAGAYTHTSIAILDAIRAISLPVVEVHMSNIYAREVFRQHSVIASACVGSISGFGLDSYRLGIEALLSHN